MGQFSLFVIELGICLLGSGLLVAALTRPLRRLLIDACGTIERADFWVVYSAAMMVIVPLLAVAALGKSTESAGPTLAFYKAAVGSALLGLFTALAVLGIQIASLLPGARWAGKSTARPEARAGASLLRDVSRTGGHARGLRGTAGDERQEPNPALLGL